MPAKRAPGTKSKAPAVPAERTPRDAAELVRKRIVAHAGPIADKLILKARDGDVTSAKFLFEFAGLAAALTEPSQEAAEDQESLVAMLLKQLEQLPEKTISAARGGETKSVS
jgi:hypothetical protein